MQSVQKTPGKENNPSMRNPAFFFSPVGAGVTSMALKSGSLTPAASSPIRRAIKASQASQQKQSQNQCSPLKAASPITKTPRKTKASKGDAVADAVRVQLKLDLRQKTAQIEHMESQLKKRQEDLDVAKKANEELTATNEDLTAKLQKSNAALNEAQDRRASLISHLKNSTDEAAMSEELKQELANVKEVFFCSVALGIKMAHHLQGSYCNFSPTAMYEKAIAEGIPYAQWASWLEVKAREMIDQQILEDVSL